MPFLLVVLLGYLAGLAQEISQPPAAAQNQQLTSWLAARHLHTGLSGYWESNVVTLTSGDRVQIRQVTPAGGRLVSSTFESKPAGMTQTGIPRTSSCSPPGWQGIPALARRGRYWRPSASLRGPITSARTRSWSGP